jgi:hypothetical protein
MAGMNPGEVSPARLTLRRFLIDLVLGALCLGVIGLITVSLINAIPLALIIVLGFTGFIGVFWLVILAGPITVIGAGLFTRRPGLIASPFVAGVLIGAGFMALAYYEIREVRSLEVRPIERPSLTHEIVVVPSYQGGDCNRLCLQILARSEHSVVAGYGSVDSGVWYRKAQGKDCITAATAVSLVQFAEAGFAGICATALPITAVSDALILSHYSIIGRNEPKELQLTFPGVFRGSVYEFIERSRDGGDRILGRWIAGSAEGLVTFRVGPRFEANDFYEAALQIEITDNEVVGSDDLLTRVRALEPLLLLPDLPTEAAWRCRDLIYKLAKSNPTEAKRLVPAFIGHPNPEIREIGSKLQAAILKLANP